MTHFRHSSCVALPLFCERVILPRLVTGRKPTGRELQVLVELLAEQKAIFEADPAAAKKLLAVGEKPSDPALPAADLAAATVLANVLLNHDEAVTRR